MVLVVEHGSSRSGRWLRRNRIRIALWIAVIEAALVIFHVVPRWPSFFLALALLAFYFFVGRNLRSDTIREASWIAAVSQLLIVALPAILALLTFAAIVLLAILAFLALAVLFLDRR
ncbi:MAG TPA: hypothetical protein VFP31_07275 [Gaiellaceae bacterium]|nr:hypothetical protein [Gaiellaceae bacterium]